MSSLVPIFLKFEFGLGYDWRKECIAKDYLIRVKKVIGHIDCKELCLLNEHNTKCSLSPGCFELCAPNKKIQNKSTVCRCISSRLALVYHHCVSFMHLRWWYTAFSWWYAHFVWWYAIAYAMDKKIQACFGLYFLWRKECIAKDYLIKTIFKIGVIACK